MIDLNTIRIRKAIIRKTTKLENENKIKSNNIFLSKNKTENNSRAVITFLCLVKKRLIVELELVCCILMLLSMAIISFVCYLYYTINNQTLGQTLAYI